jgi:hypothetical protein
MMVVSVFGRYHTAESNLAYGAIGVSGMRLAKTPVLSPIEAVAIEAVAIEARCGFNFAVCGDAVSSCGPIVGASRTSRYPNSADSRYPNSGDRWRLYSGGR